jgi:multicomponent Na+:H+ antiporter subunit C
MTSSMLFALVGVGLIGLGLYALIIRGHLLRKVLAFNVISSGVFLVLAGLARGRRPAAASDPVPQAMVLTGIVIAVAATAFALALMLAAAPGDRAARASTTATRSEHAVPDQRRCLGDRARLHATARRSRLLPRATPGPLIGSRPRCGNAVASAWTDRAAAQ